MCVYRYPTFFEIEVNSLTESLQERILKISLESVLSFSILGTKHVSRGKDKFHGSL